MFEFLVDPVTKEPLVYDKDKQELLSRGSRLAYPVKDGIPVMLPEAARQLDQHDIDNFWCKLDADLLCTKQWTAERKYSGVDFPELVF